MASQRTESREPVAEAIEDFGKLYPRPSGLNTFTVLSLSNGEPTAYVTNIHDLTCTCPDDQFNKSGNRLCKHLAATLYMEPKERDWDRELIKDVAGEIEALDDRLDDIQVGLREAQAEVYSRGSVDDSDGSGGSSDTTAWDPVAAFKDELADYGLSATDFDVWIHDELGSLQVELDGYLEDGEFEQWRTLQNDLGMSYDGDDGVSYLKEEDMREALQ